MKKKGLGKGLDAIFAENNAESAEGAVSIRISEIEPNREQPRKEFDSEALSELADSISQHGVLQPLLLRPMLSGGYRIVAGERRWRAARMAGLSEVPAVIREMTDAEEMLFALIENLQREDLNAIEEASGYKLLMERYNMTQEQVAKRVGKSRPAIANALRLLNLPEPVLEMVEEGEVSPGHARALLSFDDPQRMMDVAQKVRTGKYSVRDIERMSKEQEEKEKKSAEEKPQLWGAQASIFTELELALTSELGRKVKVVCSGKDAGGSLQLQFFDEEDLRQLAQKLTKE